MLKRRLADLRTLLIEKSLDAVLISSLPNVIYLTDFSHFHNEEREVFLLITKKNKYIFTDKRYTHAVQTHIKNFALLEIAYGHRFSELLKEIVTKEKIIHLGIEEDNISYQEYKKIAPLVQTITHFDLSPLRISKTPDEIAIIQQACAISDATFAHILPKLKEGMVEKEVAFEMELYMKQQGVEHGFSPIVAFEENAAFIHHQTGNRKLKKGDTILMDFGTKYKNYISDLSRTIFFGKASIEKKKAYVTVLEAQKKAKAFIEKRLATNEAIQGADADIIAREFIISQGYTSFAHGLGHGIGLQVHEPPSLRPPSKNVLKHGMVFTLEPGIYLPHEFGVRIEDDFAIQNSQLIQLTQSSSKLIEL